MSRRCSIKTKPKAISPQTVQKYNIEIASYLFETFIMIEYSKNNYGFGNAGFQKG